MFSYLLISLIITGSVSYFLLGKKSTEEFTYETSGGQDTKLLPSALDNRHLVRIIFGFSWFALTNFLFVHVISLPQSCGLTTGSSGVYSTETILKLFVVIKPTSCWLEEIGGLPIVLILAVIIALIPAVFDKLYPYWPDDAPDDQLLPLSAPAD